MSDAPSITAAIASVPDSAYPKRFGKREVQIIETVKNYVDASATAIGSSIGSGTAGSVLYLTTDGVLAESPTTLATDGSKLGIGTATLTYPLNIASAGSAFIQITDTSNSTTCALGMSSGGFHLYLGGDLTLSAGGEGNNFLYASRRFGVGGADAATVLATSPFATAAVLAYTATEVGVIVQGATSQSADLLQFRDSAESVLTVVDAAGKLGVGTATPSAYLDVDSDTVRVRAARTPASAAAAGNAGDICWDADYIYVCTATNTWKRSAIATWS